MLSAGSWRVLGVAQVQQVTRRVSLGDGVASPQGTSPSNHSYPSADQTNVIDHVIVDVAAVVVVIVVVAANAAGVGVRHEAQVMVVLVMVMMVVMMT